MTEAIYLFIFLVLLIAVPHKMESSTVPKMTEDCPWASVSIPGVSTLQFASDSRILWVDEHFWRVGIKSGQGLIKQSYNFPRKKCWLDETEVEPVSWIVLSHQENQCQAKSFVGACLKTQAERRLTISENKSRENDRPRGDTNKSISFFIGRLWVDEELKTWELPFQHNWLFLQRCRNLELWRLIGLICSIKLTRRRGQFNKGP